ncbi:MAG: hypothetical protein E7001_05390 [Coriobacteriaceae bacterium]|nr:hypothetical protein [Coriobacteriaceae bacterium]
MAPASRLTDEEITEIFSSIDETGVADPKRAAARGAAEEIDPLSSKDPSGSHASEAISRTALLVIVGVLAFIVILQVVYGLNRRLNTANLSESATKETVAHALESGVEWGNGFTQFPVNNVVEEADEKTGVIEVSVTDTTSRNELELLSNSQIQAAALATNALLNDKINRVVYNVYVLTDRSGAYQRDRFFGLLKPTGTRRTVLSFVWSKERAEHSSYIDWQLKIIGMDDKTAEKIQKQVNSVSSLIDDTAVSQGAYDDGLEELQRERLLHGREIFRGGPAEKTPEDGGSAKK